MKPMTEVALSCDELYIEKIDWRLKMQAIDQELNELKQSIRSKEQEYNRFGLAQKAITKTNRALARFKDIKAKALEAKRRAESVVRITEEVNG